MPQYVVVSITTVDGELLDRFAVSHWRQWIKSRESEIIAKRDLDYENCGSSASNSLLAQRIEKYVEVSK